MVNNALRKRLLYREKLNKFTGKSQPFAEFMAESENDIKDYAESIKKVIESRVFLKTIVVIDLE